MRVKIGEIAALYRYPVKSMAGESLDVADLGWHGIEGDRRFALRRVEDRSGFPWLTASKLAELVRYRPMRAAPDAGDGPTHVRTPAGETVELCGDALAAEIGRRHGSPVSMMHLSRGIFDEASVSVITAATVDHVCRLAEQSPEVRRFRPNLVVRTIGAVPFEEDAWVGGVLTIGDDLDAPAVAVTNHDVRCVMVNIDPDTGVSSGNVLKALVRVRDNTAGVYGAVTRRGRVMVGQAVYVEPPVASA